MATDNSATPGIQLPWAGKQVPNEQVENELTKLWHLAADNMRISQNMNVRTSVLNFVICTHDIESARRINALLRDLSSTNIARIILLILDTSSNAPTDISTWVTLRSFPIVSDLMRHQFEQVTALVSGAAVGYAAHTIQTFFKHDIPVYLWWVDDLPDQQRTFKNFVAISNRAIVNSEHFTHPVESLRLIEQIMHENTHSALSDLVWCRATALRELMAQFFDVPEYRKYLLGGGTITIEYAARSAQQQETGNPGSEDRHRTALSALFLAAWIKNRLGWQADSNPQSNGTNGSYNWNTTHSDPATQGAAQSAASAETKGRLVAGNIHIYPRQVEDAEPGVICLVRLQSEQDGERATFTIERGEDDQHVYTLAELPDGNRPRRTVSVAATHKESELLQNELEIMGRDHLYEEILREVLALLQ